MDTQFATSGVKREKSKAGRKKKVGVILVFMIAGSVAAYAYWTTLGEGSGSAQATSNITSTVTATVAPGADSDLWPGNPVATDLHFTVNNPNDYDIVFDEAEIGLITGSGGCAASEFTANPSAIALTPALTVPAGQTAVAGTVPGAISLQNLAENQDDCQGAIITAEIDLYGQQVEP